MIEWKQSLTILEISLVSIVHRSSHGDLKKVNQTDKEAHGANEKDEAECYKKNEKNGSVNRAGLRRRKGHSGDSDAQQHECK